MTKNIDTWGRLTRLCMAVILLAYSVMQSSWIAFGFSLFIFYEVFASWCVVYWLLGKSSCPVDRK